MAEIVYVLCVLTSGAAAALLLKSWAQTRASILFWTGLGFVGLCLNNVMLIVDALIFPDMRLTIVRTIPAVVGMALLLFGLIWRRA